MNEFDIIKEIYPYLPRFVGEDEEVNRIDGIYLPALVRNLEWKGFEYTFVITPARVRNAEGADKYYYPQRREREVELALAQLATENSSRPSGNISILNFSLTQLLRETYGITRERRFEAPEVDLAVRILSNVQYELIRGDEEFCFRPVENLIVKKSSGEMIYRADLLKFLPEMPGGRNADRENVISGQDREN